MDSGGLRSVGRTFPRRAFEDILDAMGDDFRSTYGLWDRDLWRRWVDDRLDTSHCNYLVDDKGVWLRERHQWESKDDGFLTWHPMADLDEYDQPPDLILTPILPFPFSGSDLAAYLQNGPGHFISSIFAACLEDAGNEIAAASKLAVPDENSATARIALRSAWEALVEAETKARRLGQNLSPGGIKERLEASKNHIERRRAIVRQLLARKADLPHVPKHAPAQRTQEEAILVQLRAMNIDPQRVPRAPPGLTSPTKQAVQKVLQYSDEVMRKAWKRLRRAGQIKDA